VSGPEIISNTGKVIWFHRLPAHELASDFRTQSYLGKPVLTWWQGPPNLGAVSGGTDYIYNDRYQKIAEVKGDLFISWGNLAYISEFSPTGQLLFNAQLPGNDVTYRAYRLPWQPAT